MIKRKPIDAMAGVLASAEAVHTMGALDADEMAQIRKIAARKHSHDDLHNPRGGLDHLAPEGERAGTQTLPPLSPDPSAKGTGK